MTHTCPSCAKECASAFGLKVHMRSHQPKPAKAEAAPEQSEPEAVPALEVKTKSTAEENYVEKTRSGNFALAVCGDLAVLTDLTGKRVSRPMTLDEATKVFERMATARR